MINSWGPPEDHPISIDEAKRLMAGNYGRELLRTIASYVAPIFWIAPSSDGPTIVANGTVFFLDTGTQILAVTANHVFEGYCRAKSQGQVRCQILNLDFDPEARLIDQNVDYDIATFRINKEEIQQVSLDTKMEKFALQGWPPVVPDVGRGILFAGFPGNERLIVGTQEVNFGVYTAVAVATTVGPQNFTYQIERSYLIDILGQGIPPAGNDLGGISGGPVLTLIERHNIVSWRLGGVICTAITDMDIIFATRAEVIQPDGRITPPFLP